MKTSDIFIKAVLHILGEKPSGAQGRLADKANIKRTVLNDFLKGRRNFSEERKELISEALGRTYIEMLNIGNTLVGEPSKPKEPFPNYDKTMAIAQEELKLKTPEKKPDPELDKALGKSYVKSIAKMLAGMSEEERREIQRLSEEKIRLKQLEKELAELKREKTANNG